jgi:diguanylate cyclase (GGDEF)-like protein
LNQTASYPNPTEATAAAQLSAQDAFIELIIETLQSVDRPVRGPFLQRFFKLVVQVDLTEALSLEFWDQILARRKELSTSLGKPVSINTAIVDVMASTSFLRLPVLMEYEELKKLQVNAATDALTGLYNRRLFDEYFLKELNRAKRYNHHLALVIMDLHRFKEVNDRFGHLQGDQTLQIAAMTLRKTLRASDYAFRIGGDEFALLLQQTEPDQAEMLGRRLRTSYDASIQPLRLDVPLGIDFGVATFPEDGDNREKLMNVADERLYAFKNAQRISPQPVASSRVISMDTPGGREAAPPPAPPAPKETAKAAAAAAAPAAAGEPRGAERRKWERVSMAGTRAYAVLGETPDRTARVLDLSYGGVALQVARNDHPPLSFNAVLHVPILPPVRVSLRKTYVQSTNGDGDRIGCAFVS